MDTNSDSHGRRITVVQLGRQLRSASVDAVNILSHKVTGISSSPKDHWRAILSEFAGTAIFIFLVLASGIGSLLSKDKNASNSTSLIQSALVAGGALTALIFALGHVSGGHLNPAVTVCIMIVRAIPVGIGMLYILAQLLGSIVSTAFFLIVLPNEFTKYATSSFFGLEPTVSAGSAFFVQLVVSGVLCWVVLATGVDSHGGEPRNFLAALPIGITLSVCIIVSAPLIGSSMNPAGSFGSILVYGFWRWAWIYLAVPLLAAVLVGVVYKFLFMTRITGLSAMHLIRSKLTGHQASEGRSTYLEAGEKSPANAAASAETTAEANAANVNVKASA